MQETSETVLTGVQDNISDCFLTCHAFHIQDKENSVLFKNPIDFLKVAYGLNSTFYLQSTIPILWPNIAFNCHCKRQQDDVKWFGPNRPSVPTYSNKNVDRDLFG